MSSSVYGVVANLCNELPEDFRALVKPKAFDYFGYDGDSYWSFCCRNSCQCTATENLVQEYEREFEQLSEDQKLLTLCSEAGLRLVEEGQYS